MDGKNINLLVSTFAGLGLPRTLALPVSASTTVHDALDSIYNRLPCTNEALVTTTTSNRQLRYSSEESISTLLASPQDTILPLRLSIRLCGGKGGFGSQLRAAGGRMSSRKKRNQQNQPQNGSNRNLDGRRLNTVRLAKDLAASLAKQPEMEQKEKEEKRKRWETVVELANKREEEIKSGKMGAGQGRLDAEYVESKELAEERTREAVLRAMREGVLETERTGSESSMDVDDGESEDEDEGGTESSSAEELGAEAGTTKKPVQDRRVFFGWSEDEDDEDDDSEESEEDEPPPPVEPVAAYEGKGKAKAV